MSPSPNTQEYLRRILIAEDQHDIRQVLELNLQRAGHQVVGVPDGAAALSMAERSRFDLLILDLTLPILDGLEVCKHLRAHRVGTPILMLTARTTELDRVLGLELGADDYLTKPFSMAELLARVKALMRRAELLRSAGTQAAPEQPLRNGELEVWPTRRELRQNGQLLELTAIEFDLLLCFARQPGRVFSRSQLLNAVWGYAHDGYEHTVTTHINRLRGKLECDVMKPRIILTVRGAGYKMRDPVP